jgi:hypothetical protein
MLLTVAQSSITFAITIIFYGDTSDFRIGFAHLNLSDTTSKFHIIAKYVIIYKQYFIQKL